MPLSPLAVRVRSAAVLAPPVLLVCYLGPPSFDMLIMIGAAILACEWARLGSHSGGRRAEVMLAGTLIITIGLGAFGQLPLALIALGAGGVVILVVTGGDRWLAVGTLCLGAPCLSLLWLRGQPDIGRAMVFWMIFTVWAFDTGAYLSGRAIGGPKLAPRISPNKTWAGVIGGTICAAITGAIVAGLTGKAPILLLSAAAAVVGIVGQLGDLAESSIKRHFGVKDSGTLIPGHGGLLDRVDALLAASLVTASLALFGRETIASWLQ